MEKGKCPMTQLPAGTEEEPFPLGKNQGLCVCVPVARNWDNFNKAMKVTGEAFPVNSYDSAFISNTCNFMSYNLTKNSNHNQKVS